MQTNCGHIFCKTCIEQDQKEQCPLCKGAKLPISHDINLQKLLNKLQVHCAHQKSGCGWTGELGKLDGHLDIECKFSSSGAQNKQRNMKQQKQTEEHEQKFLEVKQHMTHQKQDHFMMKDFKLHKDANAEWYSGPFYTHQRGYKLCVRIDANGYGKQRGTHVSLFICLMRGEYDDELSWPFRGEITVELLDQNAQNSREGKHHSCTIHFDDSNHSYGQRVVLGEKRIAGWGESQFIPHFKLYQDQDSMVQYLKDDCLKFRVSVLHMELPASHGSTKLHTTVPLETPQEDVSHIKLPAPHGATKLQGMYLHTCTTKSKKNLTNHIPLLKKAKEQGEKPLPSLSPMPFMIVKFRDFRNGMRLRLGEGISPAWFVSKEVGTHVSLSSPRVSHVWRHFLL